MNRAYRLTPVSRYDIPGLESWLEDLAAQGLYLVRYQELLCIFEKGEPARVRYRLEPYPRLSMLEEAISPDKEAFYRDFSWDFVCPSSPCFLIFRACGSAAPELHTDPTLQTAQMRKLIRIQRINSLPIAVSILFSPLVLLPKARALLLKYASAPGRRRLNGRLHLLSSPVPGL